MIRRQQVQLHAGEQTTAFLATTDLAEALSGLADFEGKEAALGSAKAATRNYHLSRREAFLEILQIVNPA